MTTVSVREQILWAGAVATNARQGALAWVTRGPGPPW